MTSIGLAAATPSGPWPTLVRRLRRIASTDHLVWVALALVWALGHSYVGIAHDARIYMGRALADLDPAGVGRDMMFELDGQSAFTIFRVVAKMLVGVLGLEPAAAVLTLIALVVWFVAIVVLTRTIVPGRAALLVLLVAIVLPRFYTPWHSFQAGEAEPIPRPIAEACVLLAMTALCRGRALAGFGCLVVAALFHPIMAAPGFVVLLAWLVRGDRRWLAAAALPVAAILAAAALGAPFVSRLLIAIDPAWRAITAERCPCLWVQLWPADFYGRLAIQATTIAIACAFLDRVPRFLFVCALLTGVLGGLASFVFADSLSSVLALQAQVWRALWLPAVLAPIAAGICVWRLPALGPPGLIALSLLALAWVAIEWTPLGPLSAAAAIAILGLDRCRLLTCGRRSVAIVSIVCGLMIVVIESVPISALVEILAGKPAGATLDWALIWATGVMAVPVVILACLWWRWQRTTAVRIGAGVAVVGLVCLTAVGWHSRSKIQAAGGGGAPANALRAMLAVRPGEVLWLQTDEAWAWLGRPSWGGRTQGAAAVFSRGLALKWHERALAMIAHRVGDATLLSPWRRDIAPQTVDLSKADVAGLCRRPDAPAWIIAPLETGRQVPEIPGIRVWTPGFVDWDFTSSSTGYLWTSYDRYAVVPCAAAPG